MLSNLHISNFRSFRELHVPRLSRVNLFVGPNNAGKTSILEAAEILVDGRATALRRSPIRRNERLGQFVDSAHLFHNHELEPGASFTLSSDSSPERQVHCQVEEDIEEVDVDSRPPAEILRRGGEDRALNLHFTSQLAVGTISLTLTPEGGLKTSPLAASLHKGPSPTVNFLGTEGVQISDLGSLWDQIVLEPEEEKAIEALRLIEPNIERIAFSSADSPGFFLKMKGLEQRIPLGSVGDGLKRLLALALHLSASQDGFFLIDEIDTGLHHRAMADMWRMVIGTARRLNVQVLATTHSLDCVHALAWVHETDPGLAADVTLHRVEKDVSQTVSYTAEELAIAARHHIEVR